MTVPLNHVVDALDIETFLTCTNEEEGRRLAIQMTRELGFKDVDIVFCEYFNRGVRVRTRAYLHRPGDRYPWLTGSERLTKEA